MKTVELSASAKRFVAMVESRKGQFVRVQWKSTPVVAAAHKGRVQKIVTATTQTGVDYANLAVNEGRETGSLPWGEWALFPWIIVHKDREYVRLTGVRNVTTEWFIDGESVSKADALELFTPSGRAAAWKSDAEITAFTVALENVVLVGGTVLAA